MLLASFSLEADAQNKFRLPFGKSRKTENTRLELQQTDGPWLIMCASFVGDEGEHQAKNLVRELRQKHNLNAFIYRHRFEFGNQLQGIGWEVVDSGPAEAIVYQLKLISNLQIDQDRYRYHGRTEKEKQHKYNIW